MRELFRKCMRAILPAALAAGVFLFACGASAGLLPRPCVVAGTDVSRMTRAAAAAKVRAALDEELCGRTFTVRVDGAAYTFRAPELRWETNLNAVLARIRDPGAYSVCRNLRLADEERVLRGICDDFYCKSSPARICFDPSASVPLTVEAERVGRYVDGAALKAAVRAALDAGEAEVRVSSQTVVPAFTREKALASTQPLSVFSTSFNVQAEDRAHNIALAAEKLNGSVIGAGETFSFNAAAGARTKQNGYRDAPIIFEGEFVTGTGGGVCQVSTTVYNAALLAGLTVTEYHPHSLAVGYVEPSFDAMVSGSACDLKFRNDTGAAVYLVCRVSGGTLTVRFYGLRGAVTYVRESVVTGTIPPPEAEIRQEGEEEVELRAARDGIESVGYLVRREAGKPDVRVLLRKDRYAPVRGIYCIPAPKNDEENLANSESV